MLRANKTARASEGATPKSEGSPPIHGDYEAIQRGPMGQNGVR